MKKKIILICIILFTILIGIILIFKRETIDKISYKGKIYNYLEFNSDIFTYNFNLNKYYEVDEIEPVYHEKWDLLYFNDDVFISSEEIKEAQNYYNNDNNYNWFFIVEEYDEETQFPISLTNKELEKIYNIESVKKEETMLFEEIKKFGTLKKISKDKSVSAIICLAYFNNSWYYRTGTIDINQENDPEYVIKLPETVNKKVNELISMKE